MSKVPKYGMVYVWPSTYLIKEDDKAKTDSRAAHEYKFEELKLSFRGLWDLKKYRGSIKYFKNNIERNPETCGDDCKSTTDLHNKVLEYWKACRPNVYTPEQYWKYSFRKHTNLENGNGDFTKYLVNSLKLRSYLVSLDSFYDDIFVKKGLKSDSYPIRARALSLQIQKLVGIMPVIQGYLGTEDGVLYLYSLHFLFDEDLEPIDWNMDDERFYISCKPTDLLYF